MNRQPTNPFNGRPDIDTQEVRIDFSFRREVFFIIGCALVGGLAMMIPLTFFNIGTHPGYVTWEVFGHIVGVHSPMVLIQDMLLGKCLDT